MTVQAILQMLRDERDSWRQAENEIEVQMQAAHDAGQLKVVQALRTAQTQCITMESYVGRLLEDAEALVEGTDSKPEDDGETYRIQRFYRDPNKVSETIKEGLTLGEAKEHCNSDDSKGEGWFDGFEMEG